MPITIIKGPPKSGKSAFANSLRNSQITQGQGALLIDDNQKGEPRFLVEKILDGMSLPFKPHEDFKDLKKPNEVIPTPAADLRWKKNPLIVVVGEQGEKVLAEIEKIVPGFRKHHGPVSTLNTSAEVEKTK